MAGNVNEWVMDVYRPFSSLDNEEFRPFRGNNYQTKVLNSKGDPDEKYEYVVYDLNRIGNFLSDYRTEKGKGGRGLGEEDENLLENVEKKVEEALEKSQDDQEEESMNTMDEAIEMIEDSEALIAADLRKGLSENIIAVPGDMKYRDVTLEENLGRSNYRVADNIDFRDGDTYSSTMYNQPEDASSNSSRMYDYGNSTLVNNESRVYKGGSWNDRAYWLVPGTRRFLDERKSSSTVGFRCAMTRVGAPVPFQGQ